MDNKAYTFKQQVECETNNYREKHHNYNTTQSTASNRRLNELNRLPKDWALTPVIEKRPYRENWQGETPLSREQIAKELTDCATGYGLRLGDVSDGLLAVDIDGKSAEGLLKLFPELPLSVAWTSGKVGRYQMLFKVPDKWRNKLKDFTRVSIKEREDYQCADKEQLEIRYNFSQSVLPCSYHPETGQYEWIMTPEEIEIAVAPEWLLKLAIGDLKNEGSKDAQTRSRKNPPYLSRWEKHLANFPYSDEIPLEKCLSKENQELLNSGAGEGMRNIKGSTLAYDAVATARFLEAQGQPYSGSAEDLITDFCERCSPPMSAKECRNLIKAAQKARETKRADYIPTMVASYFWIPDKPKATTTTNNDDGDDEDDKPKRLNKKQLLRFIRNNIMLAYNELTREMEVDGEPFDDEPYLFLLDEYDIDCGKETATDMMMKIAKQNSYNPVKKYLDKISTIAPPVNISNLATRYFGTSNALYDKFVEKMLIGAVARIYNPGCKLDTALVLQGEQGIGKSSFMKALGGEYFDDSMGNGSDKDDLLTLHRSWIQEWGELDRIFGKRQVGEIKQFLSKSQDNFREPYARKTERFNRHSIIVGSVNDAQFLNDATGSRRFWVIPVEVDDIDISQLQKERDGIWAAAVKAYKQGQKWWLTKQEEKESAANNDRFQIRDEWEMAIEEYLQDRDRVTISELMTETLGFENTKDMDKGSQARVATSLKSLGWIKGGRQTYKGKRQHVWLRPTGSGGSGNSEVGQTLATPETPLQSGIGSGGSGGSGCTATFSKNNDRDKKEDFTKVTHPPDPADPQPPEASSVSETEANGSGQPHPDPSDPSDPADPQPSIKSPLTIGDKVWVHPRQGCGEIVRIDLADPTYQVQVDFPDRRSWFSLEDIELLINQ